MAAGEAVSRGLAGAKVAISVGRVGTQRNQCERGRPHLIRSEQVAKMLADSAFHSNLISRIPLGRLGEPEDIMGSVLFLVSSASNSITGHALYLDGGITVTQ